MLRRTLLLGAGGATLCVLGASLMHRQTAAAGTAGRNGRVLNSAFAGNSEAGLTAFEAFLGVKTDAIQIHAGRGGIADYTGSLDYMLRQPQIGQDTAHIPIFTLPMFCDPKVGYGSESLSAVASGLYDTLWSANAATISAQRPGDQVIYVRFGEEFNGDWLPWKAGGQPGAFISAWRRMQAIFKAADHRFRFEWCPAFDQDGAPWHMNTAACYPGDDVVDVIGMDAYWDIAAGHNADPVIAFDQMRESTYGLRWHQAFASQHGKPTAYHEWGQGQEGDGFIPLMADWFKTHGPLYQGYWDEPGSRFQISRNQYPKAAAAYLAAFGHRPTS